MGSSNVHVFQVLIISDVIESLTRLSLSILKFLYMQSLASYFTVVSRVRIGGQIKGKNVKVWMKGFFNT